MGGKSKSSSSSSTTQIDKRIGIEGGGDVIQLELGEGTINFEDLDADALQGALDFGLEALSSAIGAVSSAGQRQAEASAAAVQSVLDQNRTESLQGLNAVLKTTTAIAGIGAAVFFLARAK